MHAFFPVWGCGWHRSCLPFSPRGKFLLSPSIPTSGLLVVIIVQPLVLVFGIQLASLLEHPAFSVGVIGWLIGGAMNLAGPIEYSVQTGWTISVSFERLLSLAGFRTTESGVDCRIFITIIIGSTLVLVASWLSIAIPGFGGARVIGAIASTG